MAREERKSRDQRSGGTTKRCRVPLFLTKSLPPVQYFPGRDIFPLHLPDSPYSLFATIFTSKHNCKIYPQTGKISLHISLLFNNFTYSQLFTILHFKHSGKILPSGGKHQRENFPAVGKFQRDIFLAVGKFSLLTVGNTAEFKYGAGREGVT